MEFACPKLKVRIKVLIIGLGCDKGYKCFYKITNGKKKQKIDQTRPKETGEKNL